MNATDIIVCSLTDLGAIDPGETPSATDLATGLVALNNLVANYSLDRAYIFSLTTTPISLASGTASYTTPRPARIEHATASMPPPSGSGPRIYQPVQVKSEAEWSQLRRGMSASLPVALLCDYANPTSTVTVHPAPNAAGRTLELFVWSQLTSFADLTTAVVLPAGYQRAIEWGLAVELAPSYRKPVTPDMQRNAAEAKGNITSSNLWMPGIDPHNPPSPKAA